MNNNCQPYFSASLRVHVSWELSLIHIYLSRKEVSMKNNLIVILCFTAGIFCGTFANTTISTYCEKLPQFLLYALVIQVGLNLGANAELGKMVKDIRFSSLLLPFFTIIGTLVFSAAASLLLTSWNIYDCMAVGSGFAYYSLSSLLIVQLKEMCIRDRWKALLCDC